MSAKSNDQGRAYEYAWINTLYQALCNVRNTRIVDNSSLNTNKSAWMGMRRETQELFKISADSAVAAILELEPLMGENDGDELLLELQRDAAGIEGDVRDIVVRRNNLQWEVGLSIKHNHEAVKHSRLSRRLDFGKEWFDLPCSNQYWNAVQPIFDRLRAEKAAGTSWSELGDKKRTVYVPLLQAFMEEILRSYKIDSDLPRKMVEYLIGTKDYYKIVSSDQNRLTVIQTFNTHGTLNKPSKHTVSAIRVPIVELPTELIALKFKSGSTNTVELYLNNGWQLSFRIHNASARVEPSLKFDVQFTGTPVSVLTLECKWH